MCEQTATRQEEKQKTTNLENKKINIKKCLASSFDALKKKHEVLSEFGIWMLIY